MSLPVDPNYEFKTSEEKERKSIFAFYEKGYTSTPFLLRIANFLAYHGEKVVIVSKDRSFNLISSTYDWMSKPLNPPVCAESLRNLSAIYNLSDWRSLLCFFLSLPEKTIDMSVLIIDKLDQFLEPANPDVTARVLALTKHIANVYKLICVLSFSNQGDQYEKAANAIIEPDAVFYISLKLKDGGDVEEPPEASELEPDRFVSELLHVSDEDPSLVFQYSLDDIDLTSFMYEIGLGVD